jgi:predicted DNA-binding transcriptional regulator AlpA
MTDRRHHGITPRLLRRARAAAYLDISPSHFDALVKSGALPPPKRLDSAVKAWDARDLDAHVDHLPYDGASAPAGPSDWD